MSDQLYPPFPLAVGNSANFCLSLWFFYSASIASNMVMFVRMPEHCGLPRMVLCWIPWLSSSTTFLILVILVIIIVIISKKCSYLMWNNGTMIALVIFCQHLPSIIFFLLCIFAMTIIIFTAIIFHQVKVAVIITAISFCWYPLIIV